MAMTPEERRIQHKSQRKTSIKVGAPHPSELKEGVPSLRTTAEGVVEYVKYKGNRIFKKVLDKA